MIGYKFFDTTDYGIITNFKDVILVTEVIMVILSFVVFSWSIKQPTI